jgi:hypothetical protein
LLNAVNAGTILANDQDYRWVALNDGWGSSTLSLSSVQRAVLKAIDLEAAKAKAEAAVKENQGKIDYGSQIGNQNPTPPPSSCTLGPVLCAGFQFPSNGNGDSGTARTGATSSGAGSFSETERIRQLYANNLSDLNSVAENVNYSVLANNAYHDNTSVALPPGFVEIASITSVPIGFSSTVYMNRLTGKVTIAFRGTSLATGNDALNNLGQDVGIGVGGVLPIPIFSAALNYAEEIQAAIENSRMDINSPFYRASSLDFTGHSLGGALATYVGVRTGGDAVTFNSAPLGLLQNVVALTSPVTASRSRILNFRSTNDPLTASDSHLLIGRVVTVANGAGNHSITNLMNSMQEAANVAR